MISDRHQGDEIVDLKMVETKRLERIAINPKISGGKPIIRGRRLAVENALGKLAHDSPETILQGYPWMKKEDNQASIIDARRLVRHKRVELLPFEPAV